MWWTTARHPGHGIRIFAVALALVFAGAQAFALLHGAAYGWDAHEHNGAPCQVQAVAKGLGGIVIAQAGVVPPAFGALRRPALRSDRVQARNPHERKRIRAPPHALS